MRYLLPAVLECPAGPLGGEPVQQVLDLEHVELGDGRIAGICQPGGEFLSMEDRLVVGHLVEAGCCLWRFRGGLALGCLVAEIQGAASAAVHLVVVIIVIVVVITIEDPVEHGLGLGRRPQGQRRRGSLLPVGAGGGAAAATATGAGGAQLRGARHRAALLVPLPEPGAGRVHGLAKRRGHGGLLAEYVMLLLGQPEPERLVGFLEKAVAVARAGGAVGVGSPRGRGGGAAVLLWTPRRGSHLVSLLLANHAVLVLVGLPWRCRHRCGGSLGSGRQTLPRCLGVHLRGRGDRRIMWGASERVSFVQVSVVAPGVLKAILNEANSLGYEGVRHAIALESQKAFR